MKRAALPALAIALWLSGSMVWAQSTSDSKAPVFDPAKPGAIAVLRRQGETRVNGKSGLKDVWIPPGTFQMGCSAADAECDVDEKPAHPVTIAKGFWMGQTPVTVGAYKLYAKATGKPMPPEPELFHQALNPG